MLFEYFRAFTYNGVSLTDVSINNQDITRTLSGALTTTDYFYLAQYYPFTNIHMHVNTVNDVVANWVIEYWDGTQWRAARDILDSTLSLTGQTLSRSGNIQYKLDDEYGWTRIADTSENYAPTELQGINLEDHYFLRMRPSVDLLAGTLITEIGYAFTSTERLNLIDTDINNFYGAFEAGKSDWINEIKLASKLVVKDLKRKFRIKNRGQLMLMEDVSLATDYMTLVVIYRNLGEAYRQRMIDAMQSYEHTISNALSLDTNKDGRLQSDERNGSLFIGKR